ncbi:hypothetical protein HS088_TW15G01321 [Tripterygium wilfordii]|uniref:Uncharacterized protein n=1 Tax=Tripterygium wilfordii TaxID=458696 RepID=A0A7J7CNZ5_TRIWF|nr:hypothetical protein HS088_TW15G01321 [Tripterygium wilfordii]
MWRRHFDVLKDIKVNRRPTRREFSEAASYERGFRRLRWRCGVAAYRFAKDSRRSYLLRGTDLVDGRLAAFGDYVGDAGVGRSTVILGFGAEVLVALERRTDLARADDMALGVVSA